MKLGVGEGDLRLPKLCCIFFCCNFLLEKCPQIFFTLESKDQRQVHLVRVTRKEGEGYGRCKVGKMWSWSLTQ